MESDDVLERTYSARMWQDIALPRFEILITLVIDTTVLIGAVLLRMAALRTYKWAVGGEVIPLHLRLLGWVLDYALVATAIIQCCFDLVKRVRQMVRSFRKEHG